jgi:hypothetical protein
MSARVARRLMAALALPWCAAGKAATSPAADPGPWLVFDIAKSIYATENQGGNFVIEVVNPAGRETVYRAVWGAESGLWLPQAVNMSRFAGERVKLRLQTIAAYYYSAACFLYWGRPHVVVGALEGSAPPVETADLTEMLRRGAGARHYLVDPDHSAPLKTAEYDLSAGYVDFGSAGPWAKPAIFGHRPPTASQPATAAEAARVVRVVDRGPAIPIFTWDQQVYRAAPGAQAAFDPEALSLSVRMPRTDQGFGYAFAGFEATGCDTVWLRMGLDAYGRWAGYGEMTQNRFAGVVLDYYTPRGYARRVWLHHPPAKPEPPAGLFSG